MNGQRAILERDINKRDSIIGRRRDSVVDSSSNVFDSKRAKNSSVCVEHAVQVGMVCSNYSVNKFKKCPIFLKCVLERKKPLLTLSVGPVLKLVSHM